MKHSVSTFILLVLCVSLSSAQEPNKNDGLQKRIDHAVEKGAARLSDLVARDFIAKEHGQDNAGVGALIGWALLESGVLPTDPKIKRAADQVRQYAIETPRTYSLAFAIIFLDRLGEKTDQLLIQTLAVRLLEGQYRTGGWTYTCAEPPKGTEQKILADYFALLKKREETKGKVAELQLSLTARLEALNRVPLQALRNGTTDNSNTQLAALALWVARRHGIVVDRALQLAELRFRTTQQRDGSWSYDTERDDYGRGLSMNCAGLIVTALGRATYPNLDLPKHLASDLGVRKGFAAVNQTMKFGLPKLKDNDIRQQSESSKVYYALWSLERTCLIYGLDKIHGEEWYSWGARYLVENQQEAGNWAGYFDQLHAADTCFALLFLRRANPVPDLAERVRTKDRLELFSPIEKGSGFPR